MIVMKFGGSSVESAAAIQRVAAIVLDHRERKPVVVVSAMGKTTDALLAILRLTTEGNHEAATRDFRKLRAFHLNESTGLENEIHALFSELEQTLLQPPSPLKTDAVTSFGERLSSLIVTAAFRRAGLDAVHLDARQAVVTDAQFTSAAPLFVETNALLRRKIFAERITVMGGFISATEDGITTTLGRGGSDYTAAIVGAALSVDEIQIWTDVDGMLTCDPRVVSGAHCIKSLSFAEAEQMAKAGAKVLHPSTVAPAIRQRIPIVIRNSRNPRAAGTRIAVESPHTGEVMSIACRNKVALLHIRPFNTPVTPEFSREIWDVFESAHVAIDLVATSRKELSLAVDTATMTPALQSRLGELAELKIEVNRALITLIGQNAARKPANLARASQQLCRVPGGAIMTVASDSRFAFLIPAESLAQAAEALHDEFFDQPDPAFFVPNRATVLVAARPDRSVRADLRHTASGSY
jgi:aspartate kinase